MMVELVVILLGNCFINLNEELLFLMRFFMLVYLRLLSINT